MCNMRLCRGFTQAQKVLVGLAQTAKQSLTGSIQALAFFTYSYCLYSLAFAEQAVNKVWHNLPFPLCGVLGSLCSKQSLSFLKDPETGENGWGGNIQHHLGLYLTLATSLIQHSCHYDALSPGHSPGIAVLLAGRISPRPAKTHSSGRSSDGWCFLHFVKLERANKKLFVPLPRLGN